MIKDLISTEEREELFVYSIKKIIDETKHAKIHLHYEKKGEGIDSEKIEEECSSQFFDALTNTFFDSIAMCKIFFEYLQKDNPLLYVKLERELIPLSAKLTGCKTMHALLELSRHALARGDQESIYSLGLKHFQEEYFEIAHLYFTFLSLIDSQNPEIWLIKGMAEQNLEKFQDALASYSSAISLAPGNLVTYVQMMELLLLMKRYKEAYHVYETFLREIDPDHYVKNSFMTSKLNVIRSFFTHSVQ